MLTATPALLTASTPIAQHYQAEGYGIQRQGMPMPLMEQARASLATMMAGLKPGERPEYLVEPHVKAPDWSFWLELCRHPQLVADVAAALGSDEVLLIMSHLIVKPPHDGKVVAWHQDITYWPHVHGNDAATIWLALDQVDVGNSCMHVIPHTQGSDRLEKIPTGGDDLLGVQVAVTPAMEASAVPIELAIGQYSLHDSFAIHGSVANRSDRRRAGYTMRYANAKTVNVDVAEHWVPVYYLAGNGENLKPGIIDLRPGRPLPTMADPRPSRDV